MLDVKQQKLNKIDLRTDKVPYTYKNGVFINADPDLTNGLLLGFEEGFIAITNYFPLAVLDVSDKADVVIFDGPERIGVFYEKTMQEILEVLCTRLHQVLKKELIVDFEIDDEDSSEFEISTYLLWHGLDIFTNTTLIALLYNNKEGKIVLSVAQQGDHSDDYGIFFEKVISDSSARTWLVECQNLYRQLQENSK